MINNNQTEKRGSRIFKITINGKSVKNLVLVASITSDMESVGIDKAKIYV